MALINYNIGGQMDKHHIIFKSQGGLNFELNIIELPHDFHIGEDGPHLNDKCNKKLKMQLECELKDILTEKQYSILDIKQILGLNKKDTKKLNKRFVFIQEKYDTKEIIRKLMGGRLYG